jgi:HD-like signal output (HDOD) protein
MSLDQAKRVKRITDSLISLPTLPTVIAKMLELVDNPKTSASSLSNLIMRDQVLTAKILKMANSSFYAFPRQIATVKLALVVLGFENVKEMALSLSVLNSFKGENNKHFDTSMFWQHSVSVGACTRMLARETCYRLAGEAFVAGLLHDIGKVVLNQYLPKEFAEIQTLIFEGGVPCDRAETEILGVTHAEVGAWLAERWNLPVILVEAIRYPPQRGTAPAGLPGRLPLGQMQPGQERIQGHRGHPRSGDGARPQDPLPYARKPGNLPCRTLRGIRQGQQLHDGGRMRVRRRA